MSNLTKVIKLRKCTVCLVEKHIDCFDLYIYKGNKNPRAMCKQCNLEKVKEKRRKNYTNVDSLSNEFWVSIKDYEGLYCASNLGRIKSLEKLIHSNEEAVRKERILLSKPGSHGYCSVTLINSTGMKKTFKYHRVILSSFITNPENKPEVNHINGIKTDNRLVNLEWCNKSENYLHAVRIGIRKPLRRNKKVKFVIDND